MKKIILILLTLIFILLFLYTGLSFYIADLAFKAKRNLPEETPLQYSMSYDEVKFKSEDDKEIYLYGWWIPSDNKKGVIIWVHGLDGERSGGEGKLEMIQDLNKLGYSILTFDLRGHGESGNAPLGLGIKEKNDVYGAINFLRDTKSINKVGLWGISYGAVTVIDAGINENSADSKIVGIVADTPYFSALELLTKEVSDRTPIPEFVALLLKFGVIKSGEFLHQMNINDISVSMSENNKIAFPIMILGCKEDERVPVSHPERVYENSKKGSSFYIFDYCEDHGEAYESNKEEYIDILDKYFTERFKE